MEDFIRPFCFCKCLPESWAAFMAKIIAIGYGGLCLLLTFIVANFRGILEAGNVLSSMVGGPMLGIFSLGMFTTTANEPGTLIGLLTGFVIYAWIAFGSFSSKLNIPSLPRSTAGCAADYNDTIPVPNTPNGTFPFLPGEEILIDDLSLTDDKEKYVLPIYKVSFLWFPLVGALVVFIVGYVASLIIGTWKKYPVLKPANYSPFVRRWYFDSLELSRSNISPDVELKSDI